MKNSIFNTGKVFDFPEGSLDIPTGKFQVTLPGQNNGTYTPPMSVNSKSNTCFYIYTRLDEAIRKTKGGTVERFKLAIKMFHLMGFHTQWDGTIKEPVVTWYDTEGWSVGIDCNAIIRDLLHKDYHQDTECKELAAEMHEELKAAHKETLITLDSYSELT